MNHPKMTSSGRRWAFLIGILVAFALPKHVKCGYAGATCAAHPGVLRTVSCTPYETEPWGFSLLEQVVDRDVGFAYTTGEDCE